jgi:hypothetical protein
VVLAVAAKYYIMGSQDQHLFSNIYGWVLFFLNFIYPIVLQNNTYKDKKNDDPIGDHIKMTSEIS